jgi:ATP-dependent protease HslVU (ClpYQ) peptidase subunit
VREKFLSLKKDAKVVVVAEDEEVVLGSSHLSARVASNFKLNFLSLIILGFACL